MEHAAHTRTYSSLPPAPISLMYDGNTHTHTHPPNHTKPNIHTHIHTHTHTQVRAHFATFLQECRPLGNEDPEEPPLYVFRLTQVSS
jgi:hypothetical protein